MIAFYRNRSLVFSPPSVVLVRFRCFQDLIEFLTNIVDLKKHLTFQELCQVRHRVNKQKYNNSYEGYGKNLTSHRAFFLLLVLYF